MENEPIETPPESEPRKNEPATISREDMDEAIKKAVSEAVAATREAVLKEIQDAKLKEEANETEDFSYNSLVEDLQ